MNGVPFTPAGVAAPEFFGLQAGRPTDVRVPLRLGKSLVVMQAAMALFLLVGAGLFVRTLANLEKEEDVGFDRMNLLLFSIDASKAGYKGQRLASLYQEMQRRIETIPGVSPATISRHFLINDGYGGDGFVIDGYTPKSGEVQDGANRLAAHLLYRADRHRQQLQCQPADDPVDEEFLRLAEVEVVRTCVEGR